MPGVASHLSSSSSSSSPDDDDYGLDDNNNHHTRKIASNKNKKTTTNTQSYHYDSQLSFPAATQNDAADSDDNRCSLPRTTASSSRHSTKGKNRPRFRNIIIGASLSTHHRHHDNNNKHNTDSTIAVEPQYAKQQPFNKSASKKRPRPSHNNNKNNSTEKEKPPPTKNDKNNITHRNGRTTTSVFSDSGRRSRKSGSSRARRAPQPPLQEQQCDTIDDYKDDNDDESLDVQVVPPPTKARKPQQSSIPPFEPRHQQQQQPPSNNFQRVEVKNNDKQQQREKEQRLHDENTGRRADLERPKIKKKKKKNDMDKTQELTTATPQNQKDPPTPRPKINDRRDGTTSHLTKSSKKRRRLQRLSSSSSSAAAPWHNHKNASSQLVDTEDENDCAPAGDVLSTATRQEKKKTRKQLKEGKDKTTKNCPSNRSKNGLSTSTSSLHSNPKSTSSRRNKQDVEGDEYEDDDVMMHLWDCGEEMEQRTSVALKKPKLCKLTRSSSCRNTKRSDDQSSSTTNSSSDDDSHTTDATRKQVPPNHMAKYPLPTRRVQKDILKAGDRISYYHPLFVAGNPMGYREATILAVTPIPLNAPENVDYYPLELDNAEVLPSDTRVKRLMTKRERPIEEFVLIAGKSTTRTGFQRQTERVSRIVDSARQALSVVPKHLQDLNHFRENSNGNQQSKKGDSLSSDSSDESDFEFTEPPKSDHLSLTKKQVSQKNKPNSTNIKKRPLIHDSSASEDELENPPRRNLAHGCDSTANTQRRQCTGSSCALRIDSLQPLATAGSDTKDGVDRKYEDDRSSSMEAPTLVPTPHSSKTPSSVSSSRKPRLSISSNLLAISKEAPTTTVMGTVQHEISSNLSGSRKRPRLTCPSPLDSPASPNENLGQEDNNKTTYSSIAAFSLSRPTPTDKLKCAVTGTNLQTPQMDAERPEKPHGKTQSTPSFSLSKATSNRTKAIHSSQKSSTLPSSSRVDLTLSPAKIPAGSGRTARKDKPGSHTDSSVISAIHPLMEKSLPRHGVEQKKPFPPRRTDSPNSHSSTSSDDEFDINLLAPSLHKPRLPRLPRRPPLPEKRPKSPVGMNDSADYATDKEREKIRTEDRKPFSVRKFQISPNPHTMQLSSTGVIDPTKKASAQEAERVTTEDLHKSHSHGNSASSKDDDILPTTIEGDNFAQQMSQLSSPPTSPRRRPINLHPIDPLQIIEGLDRKEIASKHLSDKSFVGKSGTKSPQGGTSTSMSRAMEQHLWSDDIDSENNPNSCNRISRREEQKTIALKQYYQPPERSPLIDLSVDGEERRFMPSKVKTKATKRKSSFGVRAEVKRRNLALPSSVGENELESYPLDTACSEDDEISAVGATLHLSTSRIAKKRNPLNKHGSKTDHRQSKQSSAFCPTEIETTDYHACGTMESSSSDEDDGNRGKRRTVLSHRRRPSNASVDSSIRTFSQSFTTNAGKRSSKPDEGTRITSTAKPHPLQRLAGMQGREKRSGSLGAVVANNKKSGGLKPLEIKPLPRSSYLADDEF